jgi:hypothetical protein
VQVQQVGPPTGVDQAGAQRGAHPGEGGEAAVAGAVATAPEPAAQPAAAAKTAVAAPATEGQKGKFDKQAMLEKIRQKKAQKGG